MLLIVFLCASWHAMRTRLPVGRCVSHQLLYVGTLQSIKPSREQNQWLACQTRLTAIYYFSEPPNFPKLADYAVLYSNIWENFIVLAQIWKNCSGSAEMVKNTSKTGGFLTVWMYACRNILRFSVFCSISMIWGHSQNCRTHGYGKTCM